MLFLEERERKFSSNENVIYSCLKMLFVVVSTRDGYNVIIQTHSCMKMLFVVVSTGDGYNVIQRQESTGFEITEDSIVDKLH